MTCHRCGKEAPTNELYAFNGVCEDCWAGNRQEGYGVASYWPGHLPERTATLVGNRPSDMQRITPRKRKPKHG